MRAFLSAPLRHSKGLPRPTMARIVMKFGGTSMAGIERIRSVARRVKREVDAGNQVAVVVSAMAGDTDRLVNFCREASSLYDPREYDVVVSSGEQVTVGLLAIALQAAGVKARSWHGLAIADPHRRRLRQGADRGHRHRGARRVAGRRRGRGDPGVPGAGRRRPRHHARPRRVGHVGGRGGGGDEGRPLRHLHRRRRRLHHRPAHRAAGAQAASK